ncbi:MAG TPA: ATP-binding cassette domain-containing protein, partial [Candidatus Didemnitutus sp.]|nr:ATP-binding cassette domain-containing protein [Candidatus Didemnitutus sp.]
DLPALESFYLLRAIYGLDQAQYQKTLDELVALLGVSHKLNVMVRELSLGERMKMELIAALLHQPRVLFLDEPTIGLDVVSQKAVRDFLRDYNRRHKTTILLTSHYMADISQLCERVIVIDHGKKIYDGNLDRIAGAGARTKIIKFKPQPAASGRAFSADWKPTHGTAKVGEDGEFLLHVPSDHVVAVCQQILGTGPVDDINIQDIPLEDVISEVFSRGVAAK